MIAEIPLPRCVSSASPWKAAITSVRNAVTSRYPVSLDSWCRVSDDPPLLHPGRLPHQREGRGRVVLDYGDVSLSQQMLHDG
jgi:hypothetical protein